MSTLKSTLAVGLESAEQCYNSLYLFELGSGRQPPPVENALSTPMVAPETNDGCDDSFCLLEQYLNEPRPATCFESLPAELRELMWKYATLERRLISAGVVNRRWKQTSNDPVPNILHVCKQSRNIGLKYFQPLLTTPTGIPRLYFNAQIDILDISKAYIHDILHWSITHQINGSVVKRLCIGDNGWWGDMAIALGAMSDFPNIKELFINMSSISSPSSFFNLARDMNRLAMFLARHKPDLETAWIMTSNFNVIPEALVRFPTKFYKLH